MFSAGEVNEVIAHLLEFGAFAVVLEALLRGAIETEGNMFEVGIEKSFGGRFIEQRTVGGEESEDSVLIAKSDAVENFRVKERFAKTNQHHVFGGAAGGLHEARVNRIGHVLFGLLVRFARAHGAIEVALGRRFHYVFNR